MSDKRFQLLQGNEAVVEGAIAAGMRFYAGYPITPSTERSMRPSSRTNVSPVARISGTAICPRTLMRFFMEKKWLS